MINTLNEENNIRRCIESIKCIADEIVVCDMYSEDKTVEVAKKLGAIVVYHEKTGYASPARYFAVSKASCDWVLVIDADEVMTEKLAIKLKEIAQQNRVDVVFVGIFYNYFGKMIRHGGFFSNNFPRFFRKNVYLETYDQRDELVDHDFFNLKDKAGNRLRLPLSYYIKHYPYPSVKSYIDKTIGKYALFEARNMFAKKEKFRLHKLIFQPLKTFIVMYILRAGFLDGIEGFILAVLYSVFRFAVWANLWFLENSSQGRSISNGHQ